VNTPQSRRSRVVVTGTVGQSAIDRASLVRMLLDRGLEVSYRSGDQSPALAEPHADLIVVNRGQDASSTDGTWASAKVIDAHGADPAALAETIDATRREATPRPAWKPWFPVIDYSRCTNCMQCLSFCLFDVYGVSSESKIQVQHESNCKTDCPACSRVCPEVAIMFPKYRHGPINGEEVTSDDVRREAMKVDISALLGGDIYSMLRDRSVKAKSRFSKERDDDRALKERQNCLVALQRNFDVPAEVLAALPTAEEILLKAEAARRRAVAAIDSAGQTGRGDGQGSPGDSD
jgi:NAD-dependent dihydropyrimidine dehydrogenase PreA subunit